MNVLLAVAAGGALGATGRYAVGVLMTRWLGHGFPWGTLTVNILGSVLMGVLVALIAVRANVGQTGQAFLMVGVLGGFTTFSSFSLDVISLVERHAYGLAAGYILGSVALSLAGILIGLRLTRMVLA